MPWDAKGFKKKHNKKLSERQAREAARTANAVLKESGDEGKAIRIANWQVRRGGGPHNR